MSGNTLGMKFRITTAGESHGLAMTCVIDGCPSQMELTSDELDEFLNENDIPDKIIGTQRIEPNNVEILSGVYKGLTLGDPITIVIRNKSQRKGDYSQTEECFPPSHGDFPRYKRYGYYDHNGGGRSSGRECIVRLIGGYIAMKILSRYGVSFESEIIELFGEKVNGIDDYIKAQEKCLNDYGKTKDSSGGVVSLTIKGVPAGVGEPVFDKLDADYAKALFSIGSVKAVENGLGIDSSRMSGSQFNDPYGIVGGNITPLTNNAGGIIAGISTGADILFTVYIKPTPKIAIAQKTVNWKTMQETELNLSGRFDINITPRIPPIVKSMAAMVTLDHMMRSGHVHPTKWVD